MRKHRMTIAPGTSQWANYEVSQVQLKGFYGPYTAEIKFVSRSFNKTGPNEYLIRGGLTMRGVTRPISLKGEAGPQKVMANGKTRMALDVTGALNRFDYGLRWDGVDAAGQALVGDEIELVVHLVLVKHPTTLAHIHRRDATYAKAADL